MELWSEFWWVRWLWLLVLYKFNSDCKLLCEQLVCYVHSTDFYFSHGFHAHHQYYCKYYSKWSLCLCPTLTWSKPKCPHGWSAVSKHILNMHSVCFYSFFYLFIFHFVTFVHFHFTHHFSLSVLALRHFLLLLILYSSDYVLLYKDLYFIHNIYKNIHHAIIS